MEGWGDFIELAKRIVSVMERNSSQAFLHFSPGSWMIENASGIVEGVFAWEGDPFSVNANDFLAVASPLLTRSEVFVAKKNEKVLIRCGRFSASLPGLANKTVPAVPDHENTAFKPLSDNFVSSADIVSSFTSTDLSSPELSSIHVTPEFVEATNRQVWCRVESPSLDTFLLPIKQLLLVEALGPEGAKIGFDKNKIFLRCQQGSFCGPAVLAEFPSQPDLGEGISLILDRAALSAATTTMVQIIGASKTETALVELSFPRRGLALLTLEYGGGTIREKIPCETEVTTSFKTILSFFVFVIAYSSIEEELELTFHPGKCLSWNKAPYNILSGISIVSEEG